MGPRQHYRLRLCLQPAKAKICRRRPPQTALVPPYVPAELHRYYQENSAMLAHLRQPMQPWREGAKLLAWHAAGDNADYTVTASDAMLHIGHFSMSPRLS